MSNWLSFFDSVTSLLTTLDSGSGKPNQDEQEKRDEMDELQKEVQDYEGHLRQLSLDLGRLRLYRAPGIKERTQKEVHAFNRLLQIMERCDAIKQSDPRMYKRNNRGREIISQCNSILDRLEQIKPT